jgi:hypothetical protein
MCWYKIGSPTPKTVKKVVLKCRSVRTIVIPAASEGSANISRIEVIKTLQTNKGILNIVIPAGRMFIIVTIIFMAPRIDEAPAMCKLKIAK